jgi:hypothetical protein
MTPSDPTRPDPVDAEVASPADRRAEAARGPAHAPPAPAPGARTVHRAAWVLAMAADLVQWVAFPLFFQGAASPINDALDVGIAIAMVWLCGFHWAFLPTVLAELVPGLNLVPTWTLAVWLVNRERRAPGRRP